MPPSSRPDNRESRQKATLDRLFFEQHGIEAKVINHQQLRRSFTRQVRRKLANPDLRGKERRLYEQMLAILEGPDRISARLAEVNTIVRELFIMTLQDRRRIERLKKRSLDRITDTLSPLPAELIASLADLKKELEALEAHLEARTTDALDSTNIQQLEAAALQTAADHGMETDPRVLFILENNQLFGFLDKLREDPFDMDHGDYIKAQLMAACLELIRADLNEINKVTSLFNNPSTP